MTMPFAVALVDSCAGIKKICIISIRYLTRICYPGAGAV